MGNFDLSQAQIIILVATSTLALLGTIVKIAGEPTRSLRNNLTKDMGLADGLRGRVRMDLKSSIDVRVHRLVSHVNFPVIKLYEWLLLLVVCALLALLALVPNDIRTMHASGDLDPMFMGPAQGMVLVSTSSILFGVFTTIANRAAKRIEYLFSVGGDDESRHVTQLLAIVMLAIPITIVAAYTAVTYLNVSAIVNMSSESVWLFFTIPVSVIIYGWFVYRFCTNLTVFEYIAFYTDSRGSKILPRLRPLNLGRSQEDLNAYQDRLAELRSKSSKKESN